MTDTPIADLIFRMLSAGMSADIVADAVRQIELAKANITISSEKLAEAAHRRRVADRERKRTKRGLSGGQKTGDILTVSSSLDSVKKEESKNLAVRTVSADAGGQVSNFPLEINGASAGKSADMQAEFDKFWLAYSKKVNKQAAFKSFIRARKKVPFDKIMGGVAAYANATKTTERRFIKGPDVWLNKGCWDDVHHPDDGRPTKGPSFFDIAKGDFHGNG